MLKDLIDLIKEGVPVLTVNTRLSRYISREFDGEMQKAGQKVWPTSEVMPLSSWIRTLWEESWPEEPLLSTTRANALWEKIVTSDKAVAGGEVLLPMGAAKTAFNAYAMMKEYGLRFPKDEIYLTEEAKALKRWAEAYGKKVKSLGFTDLSNLPDKVIALIERGEVTPPGKVVLAGFDEITPRTKDFLETLKKNSVEVTFWPKEQLASDTSPEITKKVKIMTCADEREEVISAARWIREVYRPGMRIGIIVPQLERYRDLIIREFNAELDPASVLPESNSKAIFNISMGRPLSEEPIVRSAIDILTMNSGTSKMERLSSLLLSPYLAEDESEHMALAKLDARLRGKRCAEASLADIMAFVKRSGEALDRFGKRLDWWMTILKKTGKKLAPSEWTGHFNDILKALKWPSPGVTLSSEEYQALQAWNALLSTYAGLNEVTGKLDRSEAIRKLTHIAGESLHQPESPDAPIQVLGLLESSGIFFDHIRILGGHEDALPPQPSPNPFIPIFMQKGANLPHSSCERELAFARVVTGRLLESAGNIDVSFPRIVDDREMNISPLFGQIGQVIDQGEGPEGHRFKDAVHSNARLEDMTDDEAVPLAAEEAEAIRGGTTILKDQSACPFRAFAAHRLRAKALDAPEAGLSAGKRGSLLHSALKEFWQDVGDSGNLQELISNGKLEEKIGTSLSSVLGDTDLSSPFSSKFLAIERGRLQTLMTEWLELESGRPPFRVLLSEARREIVLGGLTITGDIDRIDDAGDGGEIIIDYKTGKSDPKDWETNRPKEPQLMAYSTTGNFDAVTFARVRHGECKFTGIARAGETISGLKVAGDDDWEELIEGWKEVVEDLADSFVSGIKAVDPRDYGSNNSACKHCDLDLLCRVFENKNS